MHGILMFTALVIIGMIYLLGYLIYQQKQQVRGLEDRQAEAAQERATIREDVTVNRYQIEAYGVILNQFPAAKERHLRNVARDEQRRA